MNEDKVPDWIIHEAHKIIYRIAPGGGYLLCLQNGHDTTEAAGHFLVLGKVVQDRSGWHFTSTSPLARAAVTLTMKELKAQVLRDFDWLAYVPIKEKKAEELTEKLKVKYAAFEAKAEKSKKILEQARVLEVLVKAKEMQLKGIEDRQERNDLSNEIQSLRQQHYELFYPPEEEPSIFEKTRAA